LKNPQNKQKTSYPKGTAKSRVWGAETPEPIATKFYTPCAIQDAITPANFCEDRLRGFGVMRGRILDFSIDLLCRLHNTLALPCECVMYKTAVYTIANGGITHQKQQI